MAADEVTVQPVQDQPNMGEEEALGQDTAMQKSGVGVDPTARMQQKPRKFNVNDTVHMSLTENGNRTKGIFKIAKVGYNFEGGYPQYQLIDKEGQKGSTYIRESKLKLEKRG